MVNRAHAIAMAALLLAGCGLDPQIWGGLTASNYTQPPGAGTNTVSGVASALGASATVRFYGPAGTPVANTDATTADGGTFATELLASATYTNTIVAVSTTSADVLGLVPQVPAKTTVYDASVNVSLGTDLPDASGNARAVPFMDDLGAGSTTATLLLLAKQRYGTPPSTLAAVSPSAVVGALEEIQNLLDTADPRVQPFADIVTRLLEADATAKPAFLPFPTAGASYLDPAALKATTDYTGDGQPDGDTVAFDAALQAAIGALEFNVCYAQDSIRVVLMVDFNAGQLDRNCSVINIWKWTQDLPGKQMFITGSLHESTPNCDNGDPQPCLTSAVFDAANQLLGNWTPNVTPMFDDGTNGDEVAGDNIWTYSLVLPWFDAGAPSNRWVRISYKFTWGTPGHLWTGTEEWPGNQRILELRDTNGDHMIVRRDNYGDETTNKDKSNLLAPNKGGGGTVLFASDVAAAIEGGRKTTCVDDPLENMVDFDKDCVLDGYPSPGTSSPVTIPCPE